MRLRCGFTPECTLKERLAAFFVSVILAALVCPTAHAAKGELFVVGLLYKRHETVAAYDLSTLVGTVDADTERRWNQHTVRVALRAVKENPGKRVLVLVGIDNCYMIRDEFRRSPKVKLVDMEQWFRANAQ